MSCATCHLCGNPLGLESWTTLCGGDCVDRFAAGVCVPRASGGQLTLAEAFARNPVRSAPVAATLDLFAAEA